MPPHLQIAIDIQLPVIRCHGFLMSCFGGAIPAVHRDGFDLRNSSSVGLKSINEMPHFNAKVTSRKPEHIGLGWAEIEVALALYALPSRDRLEGRTPRSPC